MERSVKAMAKSIGESDIDALADLAETQGMARNAAVRRLSHLQLAEQVVQEDGSAAYRLSELGKAVLEFIQDK